MRRRSSCVRLVTPNSTPVCLSDRTTTAKKQFWQGIDQGRGHGELQAAGPKHPPGPDRRDRPHDVTEPPTLADKGITKMESSRWQAVAFTPSRPTGLPRARRPACSCRRQAPESPLAPGLLPESEARLIAWHTRAARAGRPATVGGGHLASWQVPHHRRAGGHRAGSESTGASKAGVEG